MESLKNVYICYESRKDSQLTDAEIKIENTGTN